MFGIIEFVCLLHDCKEHHLLPKLEKFNLLLMHFIKNNIIFQPELVKYESIEFFHHFLWACIFNPETSFNMLVIPIQGTNELKQNGFKYIQEILTNTNSSSVIFLQNFVQLFQTAMKNLQKLILMTYEKHNQKQKYMKWNQNYQENWYETCKEIMLLCK